MEMEKTRKILAIDDNRTNLVLIEAYLKQMGIIALLAKDALSGIKIAIEDQPDLILLDIMMPNMDGFEVCKRLKADSRTSSIPIIFVSAKDQVEDKITGLKLGAIDYVTKPFDEGELKARIGIVLKMVGLQEVMLSRANTDELTGLANRRYFFEVLEREILQTKIKGYPLSIIMLDIDHFKSINDTYGHLTGDLILEQMGKLLHDSAYPMDVVARYGGDEFIILMAETSIDNAERAAERLRKIVEGHPWKIEEQNVTVTISAGVAAIDKNNLLVLNELIRRADIALYAAKGRGRNSVVRWGKLNPDEKVKNTDNHNFIQLQTRVSELTTQLREQAVGTISAFVNAMTIKDPYRTQHTENVQVYAAAIAEQMGLSAEITEQLNTAILLHDVGKISIPNSILKKTTPLTEDEIKIIRQHPVTSTKILEPIGIFHEELKIIRHHHEWVDGTGYPDGLKGKEIKIAARILAVADTFDAMTSDNEYRPAKSYEYALSEIDNGTRTQFDPDVVAAFKKANEKHKYQWPLSQKKHLVESPLLS